MCIRDSSNIFIPFENCIFDIGPSFHFDDICTRFILEGRAIYTSERDTHRLFMKEYSYEYDVFIPEVLRDGITINSVYALTQYVAILIARTLCTSLQYVQVNVIYFCDTELSLQGCKGIRYPVCVNENVPICKSTLSAIKQRRNDDDANTCLLYTSDAADERSSVDLG